MSQAPVRSVKTQVEALVSTALADVLPEFAESDPVVRRSEHADFQANVALALAKKLGRKPRELAAEISRAIDSDVEVSGPGFFEYTAH